MGAAAALAAVSLATTIATQSMAAKGPSMPKAPTLPVMPDRKGLMAGNQQADQLAKSAGGTILSDPKANAGIADGANATRKQLLGS
jgi:hypothetical protein